MRSILGIFGAVLLAGCLWTEPVRAQACCAAASPIAPGRLALHERALVGAQLLLGGGLGSFDGQGQYHGNPSGYYQIDTQFTAFGTARIVPRLQVSASIPLLVSFRGSQSGDHESGGGIGDLGTNLRYDVVRNREFRFLPGIGLIAGFTAPTGRAPESSQNDLGSDITGLGAWQLSAGIWLERSFEGWLVTGAGWVSFRPSRSIDSIDIQLAPQGSLLLALGYSLTDALGLSLSGTYFFEGNSTVNGTSSPASGRRQTRLSLGGSFSWNDSFRLLCTAFLDPPIDTLSQNSIPQLGLSTTFIWSFL